MPQSGKKGGNSLFNGTLGFFVFSKIFCKAGEVGGKTMPGKKED